MPTNGATVSTAGATGLAGQWQHFMRARGLEIPAFGTSWPAVWWTEATIGAVAFALLVFGMPKSADKQGA